MKVAATRVPLALVAALAACSRTPPESVAAPSASSSAPIPASLVAARPYVLRAPAAHDARAPLLVLLHGYGSGHADVEHVLGAPLGDAHGVYVALPDGTPDSKGLRFWNATDVCCDFDRRTPDDVAYIDAILDDAMARAPIDPAKVYVGGFSNGGFMAHRYACDRASRVAGVVSFAGAGWADASKCAPAAPVSVLEVHGDADVTVRFEGGSLAAAFSQAGPALYPSARRTIDDWARRDACPGSPTVTDDARVLDVRYAGCAAGAGVELWGLHGAGHIFPSDPTTTEKVWTFLAAHARR